MAVMQDTDDADVADIFLVVVGWTIQASEMNNFSGRVGGG